MNKYGFEIQQLNYEEVQSDFDVALEKVQGDNFGIFSCKGIAMINLSFLDMLLSYYRLKTEDSVAFEIDRKQLEYKKRKSEDWNIIDDFKINNGDFR